MLTTGLSFPTLVYGGTQTGRHNVGLVHLVKKMLKLQERTGVSKRRPGATLCWTFPCQRKICLSMVLTKPAEEIPVRVLVGIGDGVGALLTVPEQIDPFKTSLSGLELGTVVARWRTSTGPLNTGLSGFLASFMILNYTIS